MNGEIYPFSLARNGRKKKFSFSPGQRAEKPFSNVSLAEKKKVPYTPEFAATKSKYRPVYQISLFAHLSPGQILVGVATPNPPCRPRGLHIIRFRTSAKVHSFRRSSSPHKVMRLCGAPHERRRKIPRKCFPGFFKNSSALHPVFLLLVRGQTAAAPRKIFCGHCQVF